MKLPVYLVTGAAGFIGSNLTQRLAKNATVIGIDNFYPNYDHSFKKKAVAVLEKNRNFFFHEIDIRDRTSLQKLFKKYPIDTVFHLAALTGVRASLANPMLYTEINAEGTKIMYEEAAKSGKVQRFILTSSSSVYGNGPHIPFIETQQLSPQSPYAKSKVEAEKLLMLLYRKYSIPTIVFRLFSVYGPNGRPDMAPYLFTEAAYKQQSIIQYGDGNSARDYTHVNDVVAAFEKVLVKHFSFETINVGNHSPITLKELIKQIEINTGKKIKKNLRRLNSAESKITYANITKAKKLLNWEPHVAFTEGVEKFIRWFIRYRLKYQSK